MSTYACLLSSWVPKTESTLLLSVSMVYLIEEWHWFKISRKLPADALSDKQDFELLLYIRLFL